MEDEITVELYEFERHDGTMPLAQLVEILQGIIDKTHADQRDGLEFVSERGWHGDPDRYFVRLTRPETDEESAYREQCAKAYEERRRAETIARYGSLKQQVEQWERENLNRT